MLRRQRRVVGDPHVANLAIVVGAFDAIDQRASLEGHTAAVVLDLLVGQHAADRHRQVQLDHVTRLPLPIEHGIAIRQFGTNGLAVHTNRPIGRRRIDITIEIARQTLRRAPKPESARAERTVRPARGEIVMRILPLHG